MENLKKKILIVEDEASIATMYAMKFERSGYDVKIAKTGISGIVESVEFRPDAILLDIMMPSMDGFETLRAIRKLAPSMRQVRILVFSNLSSEEDRQKAYDAGADDYLIKVETNPAQAVAKVEEALSSASKNPGDRRRVCPDCGKRRFGNESCCH